MRIRRIRQPGCVLVAFNLALVLAPPSGAADKAYIRGDSNVDGAIDLPDAVFILESIFLGETTLTCPDAADANDDGDIDLADSIYILGFLFLGSSAPPAPHPDEGLDPTSDGLDCPAPEAVVLRRGSLFTRAHGVRGRVEHWSDGTIRLTHFYYDGGGVPEVLVWLHDGLGSRELRAGYGIGDDLLGRVYRDETIVVPIPPEITPEMFSFVSIWCTSFSLNYGFAQLFPPQ